MKPKLLKTVFFVIVATTICSANPINENHQQPAYSEVQFVPQVSMQSQKPNSDEKFFWNNLADLIQNSNYFPIEFNVPDAFNNVFQGMSNIATDIRQRIPFINRLTNPNGLPRPYQKYYLFMLNPNEESINSLNNPNNPGKIPMGEYYGQMTPGKFYGEPLSSGNFFNPKIPDELSVKKGSELSKPNVWDVYHGSILEASPEDYFLTNAPLFLTRKDPQTNATNGRKENDELIGQKDNSDLTGSITSRNGVKFFSFFNTKPSSERPDLQADKKPDITDVIPPNVSNKVVTTDRDVWNYLMRLQVQDEILRKQQMQLMVNDYDRLMGMWRVQNGFVVPGGYGVYSVAEEKQQRKSYA